MDKLAIVFPGQGSQRVGMLSTLAKQYTEIEAVFSEASLVLGYDLWALVQHGPPHELEKTVHTQPALLAASYALWQLLQAKISEVPAFLAGHSLGEYTALVCAQALAFSDAIQLVAARGQFMQEAVPAGQGAMAAIMGLDEANVATICDQAKASYDDMVSLANFNSPGQIVISGYKITVDKAVKLAKEKGAKLALLLPVSVPSHCLLMKPASLRLGQLLETIELHTPRIPVINNAQLALYDSVESIRQGLMQQLYLPVRWVDTLEKFKQGGVTRIIECGPGKVLTGLNKRIDKNLKLGTVEDVLKD